MNNNVIPMPASESSEAQAREWIVRIDAGALTAGEREELRQWLAADPANKVLLDSHALLWSVAAKAKFPATEQRAREFHLQGPGRRQWIVASAVACTAVFVAGVALGPKLWQHLDAGESTFATAIGEHQEHKLADGSTVHLNTASTARVTYEKDKRRVVLETGEGFFAVAKDRSRPFEVVAGRALVRAVGTQFSVRRVDQEQVEVIVFEGVVDVINLDNAKAPLRMRAGEAATDTSSRVVMRSFNEKELQRELGWQQDRIDFERTPLSTAIDEVNRYSRTPLVLKDSTLEGILVSGSFSTHDIPVFLRSLESGFGLKVDSGASSYDISRNPEADSPPSLK